MNIRNKVTGELASITTYDPVTGEIIDIVAPGNISAVGNIEATANVSADHFIGNGYLLTSLNLANATGGYGDANVAAFISSGNSTPISVTGNISGDVFIGNGAGLTDLTGANVTGQVTSAINANTVVDNAQPNITSVGILSALSVTGNVTPGGVSTVGNVTADYFIGNGSALTGLPAGYGNANLADIGSNAIGTTGNITAGYFIGDGSLLSSLTGPNVVGSVPLANVANTVSDNAQPNITSVGELTSLVTTGLANVGSLLTSNLSLYGNTIGSLGTSNLILDPLNDANPVTGEVIIYGNLSVTGNVTYVDVSTAITSNLQWTAAANATTAAQASGGGLEVGNVSTPYASWLYNSTANAWVSDIAIVATGGVNANGALTGATTGAFSGAVTAANITGDVITGNLFAGDGGLLSNVNGANIVGSYGNANAAAFMADFGSNVVSTTGNVTAGYFIGNGSQLTGMYGNAEVAVFVGDLGANAVSTTGNVTASYFLGNGALLSDLNGANIIGGYGNANVVANLAALGSNPISTTGNITGGYILGNGSQLSGLPEGYGNANLANLGSNAIVTTGNISGGVFIGNGSGLSDLVGANVTGNVPSATIANTVTNPVQSNITSVGTLTSLSVSGNIAANNIAVTTEANLGNVANIVITGGANGQFLQTDGNGNVSFANAVTVIPAVYFTAASAGNNQTFSNTVLASYAANTDISLYYNGSLLESDFYTLSGDTITLNTPVRVGDSISVTRQFASSINVVASNPYGNSNVAAYLPTYTGTLGAANIVNSTGNSNIAFESDGSITVNVGNVANVAQFTNYGMNLMGNALGYLGIPQLQLTANTTLQLSDNGKHYYATTASGVTQTITVPSNANVAFQLGSTVSFVLNNLGTVQLVPQTGVNLYVTGNATPGTRTLSPYSFVTMLKVDSDTWFVSGTGVS